MRELFKLILNYISDNSMTKLPDEKHTFVDEKKRGC